MDQSRILLIGQSGPFRASRFGDPPNLAEFGAVIWYPKQIGDEWHKFGARQTAEQLPKLIEWIKKGNTLVIVGAAPENSTATYFFNGKEHKIDILTNEIFRGLNFRSTSGFLIEYHGPKILTEELSAFASLLSYDAILEAKDLTPLFRVSTALSGDDQLVGAYRRLGNGIVV